MLKEIQIWRRAHYGAGCVLLLGILAESLWSVMTIVYYLPGYWAVPGIGCWFAAGVWLAYSLMCHAYTRIPDELQLLFAGLGALLNSALAFPYAQYLVEDGVDLALAPTRWSLVALGYFGLRTSACAYVGMHAALELRVRGVERQCQAALAGKI
jgi:prepilin signal peptidase PulO-like enzyme (type II secretory pathway)